MAIASVVCASLEIEPKDIAPVEKRLTISAPGSTSSIDIGLRPSASALFILKSPRIVFMRSAELFTISANSR